MASYPCFFTLPPELRTKIYREYFVVEGGYILDFEAGKLTTADGHRIDLSLVSTCKFIAQETQSIPFAVNTITFSTVYTKNSCQSAGLFQNLLHQLFSSDRHDLESAKRLLAPEVCSEVIRKFPRFAPTLQNLVHSTDVYRRMVCSTLQPYCDRQAITYTVQLLARLYGMEYVKEVSGFPVEAADPLKVLDLCRVPWAFPTKAHLNRMARELGNSESLYPLNGRQYRFTAASVAIRFLDSISVNARLRIRNIVLQEDRRAGAFPECHAQGLIPFCQENRLLRIERRVNLWRTIFQEPDMDWWDHSWFPSDSRREYLTKKLTSRLCDPLGPWLFEALGLLDDGMPPESFTLVLDGDPAPDLTTEVFQAAIHQDIAWRRAFKEAYARNILPTPQYPRSDDEPFLRAMQHLVNKTSVLRCNFDPGEFWDFEKIIEQAYGWDSEKWHRSFSGRLPIHFEITPPLPKWSDLLLDNFDPEWRNYWATRG